MIYRLLKGLLVAFLLLNLSFVFMPISGPCADEGASQQNSFPGRIRFSAGGGTEGRGIFYIDELFPLYYSKDKATLWFINPKENWQTPNAQEYNIGTGLRHIFDDKFIVGIHYFFDKKLSHNDIWHNQNGVGLEFLSRPFDFRFNWYDPLGKDKATLVSDYYKFGQMDLLQAGSREEALGGYDFEFGVPVFEKQTRTRLYMGGFFFDSKIAKDVNGFRVRTETNLNKWLALDTTFNRWANGKNEVIGGFRVTVPFELSRIAQGKNPIHSSEDTDYIQDRLFERVVRDIDVKTNTTKEGEVTEKVPGVEMIYADNSNTTGIEDGTLAHPWNTLGEAFNDPRYIGKGGTAHYIYVFNGDGSSSGYSDDYSMAGNSVLWGSGYNGGFNGIPTSGFPLLLESTLELGGDNVTVMGLHFEEADGSAIYGSNISNVNINHNMIMDSYGNGVYLECYGANSGWNITNNTISLNTGNGIYLYTGEDTVDPLLSNVNISGNDITNNSHGIYMENYTVARNLNISGNNISNNGIVNSGVHINNYGEAFDFNITGNDILDNSGTGVYISNFGLAENFNISGNLISGNTSPNSGLDLYNYGTAINFNILGNSITGNSGDGIYLQNGSGRPPFLEEGLLLQPDGDGEELPSGMFNFNISGNSISGNGGDGIHIENGSQDAVSEASLLQPESEPVPIGDLFNFNITKNTISGNGGAGIYLSNHPEFEEGLGVAAFPSESEFTGGMTGFNISDNIITGNSLNQCGIDIYNYGFMEDFAISNNLISGNSGAGIDIYNSWGEFHDLAITNNTITDNTGAGIDIENYDDMGVVTVSGNTISGNSSKRCGIDIYSDDAYTHDFTFSNNTISDNGGSGIDIYSEYSDTENFTFSLNKITGNTYYGIEIGNYRGGMSGFSFTGNTITGNGLPMTDGLDGINPNKESSEGGGVYINNHQAGMEDFTFTGNNISNNYGDGFYLNNYHAGADNFSFSLNTISNNAGVGLYFGTTQAGTHNIDLGGGSLGSLGLNTIQDNQGKYDLINDTNDTIVAQNNTWTRPFDPSRIYGDVIY